MTAHTITLTLPEDVYKLLQAQAITRSLDEVATRYFCAACRQLKKIYPQPLVLN
jgi:hypothetical protein